MKYKFLIIFQYYGYKLKPKYKNLANFTFLFV